MSQTKSAGDDGDVDDIVNGNTSLNKMLNSKDKLMITTLRGKSNE